MAMWPHYSQVELNTQVAHSVLVGVGVGVGHFFLLCCLTSVERPRSETFMAYLVFSLLVLGLERAGFG